MPINDASTQISETLLKLGNRSCHRITSLIGGNSTASMLLLPQGFVDAGLDDGELGFRPG